MTSLNSSARHYLPLKPHLGDALAKSPLLNEAYGIALAFSSEASVSRSLILTASLSDVLRGSPSTLAVSLLSSCVMDQGTRVLERVREADLIELYDPLRYFLPTPAEPRKFTTAVARWDRDTARWASAPDELKIIRLAAFADTIRRREWFNFLQRQQLLERASMFVEACTMSAPDNQRWVDDLRALISEYAKSGETPNSALHRMMR